jgi:hypothetical protein
MVAIEVEINGERYCLAGVPAGVTSAFVNHVDIPAEPNGARFPSTTLTVNGFHFHFHGHSHSHTDDTSSEGPGEQTAVHWRDVTRTLRPGDEVRLRIVETDSPDPYTVTPMLPALPEDEG